LQAIKNQEAALGGKKMTIWCGFVSAFLLFETTIGKQPASKKRWILPWFAFGSFTRNNNRSLCDIIKTAARKAGRGERNKKGEKGNNN